MSRDHEHPPAYVRHTGGAAWGVGVLVAQTRDQRTYLFADGVRRSFKEAFCERFIVPAEPPSDEDGERLSRGQAAGGVATPKAIHLELEAEIHARPDDPGPYLVYADWLQQREDPRGQLIAVQHQLALDPDNQELRDAEHELLETHGTYLLPARLHQLLRLPRRKGEESSLRSEIAWSRGFLASARIARRASASSTLPQVPEIVDELLGHPSAHFLRRLAIGPLGTEEEYNYIDTVDAIAKRGHERLEELVLGDFGPEMALAFSRAGNVAPLFAAAPHLQRLQLRAGSLRFETAIHHAELRELSVIVAAITEVNIRRLLQARLPALESLELSCPALDLTDLEFDAMLQGTTMPRLRRVAFHHTVGTLRALEAILHSPLLAQLEVIELDHGDLDDRDAESLATIRAPLLKHLKRLDVSGNPMSPEAADRLARLCGSVQAAPVARALVEEDDVIARAADARSVLAARAIAHPDRWLVLGRDHDRVWGEYDGTDNYYVWARLDDHTTGCNCNSHKDPCKHVLALLLIAASEHDFVTRPIPDAFARRIYERPRHPPAE